MVFAMGSGDQGIREPGNQRTRGEELAKKARPWPVIFMRMPLTLIVGFVHMDLNGLSPLAQGWASELGESGDFGHILEGSTSRSHGNCYFGYGHSQGIRGALMWSQVSSQRVFKSHYRLKFPYFLPTYDYYFDVDFDICDSERCVHILNIYVSIVNVANTRIE
uniref:HDC11086 n=1 Tax=Drosophila melanogaster TaxID=7227 RepID=Q6IKY1_DROME|nr:TPA_inf: HDC11086 [Drosophila melanogaster]